MEFFHKVTTYPFMHTRRMWYGVSSLAIVASIVLLFWHGLNLGIDFTGGVVLEFQYPQKADLEKTRATLEGKFTHPQVQNFGDDRTVAVRLLPQANQDVNAVRLLRANRRDGQPTSHSTNDEGANFTHVRGTPGSGS